MKNPWETGETFHGIRVAACCVDDRKRMVHTMDVQTLRAALNHPDTQKAVQSAIRARLRKMGVKPGAGCVHAHGGGRRAATGHVSVPGLPLCLATPPNCRQAIRGRVLHARPGHA